MKFFIIPVFSIFLTGLCGNNHDHNYYESKDFRFIPQKETYHVGDTIQIDFSLPIKTFDNIFLVNELGYIPPLLKTYIEVNSPCKESTTLLENDRKKDAIEVILEYNEIRKIYLLKNKISFIVNQPNDKYFFKYCVPMDRFIELNSSNYMLINVPNTIFKVIER